MKCKQVEDKVRARLDGELESSAAQALRAHLELCTPCAQRAREVEQCAIWLRAQPLTEPSENFDWRLRLRLAQAERESVGNAFAEPQFTPHRGVWSLQFGAAAAVAALAVLTLGMTWINRTSLTPAGTRIVQETGAEAKGVSAATKDVAAGTQTAKGDVANADVAKEIVSRMDRGWAFDAVPTTPSPRVFPAAGPPNLVDVTDSAAIPLGPYVADRRPPSILGAEQADRDTLPNDSEAAGPR